MMIKQFVFILIFLQRPAFAFQPMSWDSKNLSPLYQSCKKDLETHLRVYARYERKADVEVKSQPKEKVFQAIEKKNGFGNFLTYWSPHLIPAGGPLTEFFTECWADFENFKRELKKNNSTEAQKSLTLWKSCVSQTKDENPPAEISALEVCMSDLLGTLKK